MADYATNAEHNINGVDTVEDYDLYCHYVAGLVGDGLTRLFVESGLANPALLKRPELAESMGQFLQKTNIIRDVREDFDDKRRFWPKEIWSKHVTKFDDLFDPQNLQAALACSSEMVLNSLRHADECLFYMAGIKDQSVFNFVAIPQSMAIATLELVFQNPKIFEKNVKITKGDACELMMKSSQNLRSVCEIFKEYARRIHKKNTPKDPNFLQISIACAKVIHRSLGHTLTDATRLNNSSSLSIPRKIRRLCLLYMPERCQLLSRRRKLRTQKRRVMCSIFCLPSWEHCL
jgi:farnesyl-diphosphate farnesyltransferase